MKSIKSILKSVLLVFELIAVIIYVHWDKFLFVSIVAVDQFIKGIIVASMSPGESIPIFKHVFHLTYVLNPGAAFGILPNQREIFLLAGGLILVAAAIFYSRIQKTTGILKFGMISLLSGAAANLIDRFQNGLVVDFLDFRIWPVFNIADIAIVVGMCCMIYTIIFDLGESGLKKVIRD